MPTTKFTMPVAETDSIEYVDTSIIKTQWVETVSLPIYPINNNTSKTSKVQRLSRNYTLIKHMMGEVGLRLNYDYIIIPNTNDVSTIDIKFTEQSQQHASMCVLLWMGKYKDAKTESTL